MDRFVVKADGSDDKNVRKKFVTEGLECSFRSFIVRSEDKDFLRLGKIDALFSENGKIMDDSFETVEIIDSDVQEYAMSLSGKKNIIVSTKNWKIIPMENMIGAFHRSSTEIYAVASDIGDAKLFLSTMENGVNHIIIDIKDYKNLKGFSELMHSEKTVELKEVKITSIVPVEMGDRVCIDTCVSMSPGEGMLIGSYSNCLFLVQSESEESGYVSSRPFRVNAGAIHSYVQSVDGKTRYLSEIASGETVLICDSAGKVRVATVGRCKIEKRPLLMIKASDGKNDYSVILQNAETVKLVTVKGAVSVTELKKGDTVLAKLSSGGRHFGMSVDETVSEI